MPLSGFTQVLITAEFVGQPVGNCPDNTQAFIDTALVIIAPALIQAGQCDIDRRMVIALRDELLNPVFFLLDIHFCMSFTLSGQYNITR